MRKVIYKEGHIQSDAYFEDRSAAVEAIKRFDEKLDSAADGVGCVLALLADIPVRSRFITLTCMRDGTVGLYCSSDEARPSRFGRNGRQIPPMVRSVMSRIDALSKRYDVTDELAVSELTENVKNTRVYLKCRDGFRSVEYNMDTVDECNEDIKNLDAMLKQLLRTVRRSKIKSI